MSAPAKNDNGDTQAKAKPRRAKIATTKIAPSETDTQRLVRHGAEGPSLSERFTDSLRTTWYRSGVYRLRLRGRYPLKLQIAPPDLWAGDAARGRDILQGQLGKANIIANLNAIRFSEVDAPLDWLAWMHGFGWLRDLAAAAPDVGSGAVVTERLVKLWLRDFSQFHKLAWRPDVLGVRLMAWIGHANLLLSSSDQVYRSAVLTAFARQVKHLSRTTSRAPDGLPRLQAAAGLVAAGLALPGRDGLAERGGSVLDETLIRFVLPDGGIASRCPEDMLGVLKLLLTVRSLYHTRGLEPSATIVQTMDRLVPALRGLVFAGGTLASFHGGGAGVADQVTQSLSLIEHMTKPLKNAAYSGYQRLEGGRSVAIIDAGPPPPGRMSINAHASTLSFQFADGAQRFIVNCGGTLDAPSGLSHELLQSLRSTAAHSTLIINDVNSTQIRPDGLLGKGVGEVTVVRQENEDGTWVDAVHDGYVARFGVAHRRRIFLSADGIDLRGEEMLSYSGKRRPQKLVSVVRFHLAPGITAVPTQGNTSAALKLPNGTAWMFRCKGAELEIAESLVVENDTVRRTTQLVLTSHTDADSGSINWLFKRSAK